MNITTEEIKILLVDDHQLMRQGLRKLLSNQSGLTVIGEAFNSQTVMEQIRTLAPHVVLMDIHLASESGVEITTRILAEFPSIKVIALSSDSELELVRQALNAGVSGYILKENNLDELIRAIHAVMDHRLYFSPEISSVVIKDFLKPGSDRPTAPPGMVLTHRERLLLQLIAEGKRNKEISVSLTVAVKSVETYRSRLMKKLGCAGTADLVRYAIRQGIIRA